MGKFYIPGWGQNADDRREVFLTLYLRTGKGKIACGSESGMMLARGLHHKPAEKGQITTATLVGLEKEKIKLGGMTFLPACWVCRG